MSEAAQSTPTTLEEPPAISRPPGWQSRTFLLVTCILAWALFWWAGGLLGIARERGFAGSLLSSSGPVGNVLGTGVLLVVTVVLGTVLAGFIRPDAGLLAAAFGLMALSVRGRSVVSVLHEINGRSVFLILALELVLLYAFIAAAWWLLFSAQRSGWLHRDAVRDGLSDVDLPANAGWGALMTHVAIMATAVILIAQSEDKKQVLAAVAIGSFLGAFFPYWQHGARPSVWYWSGPLVVGLAGYVMAFISPPLGMDIGRVGYPAGFLAALVRPLPLDYAGAGTAGALLGYWMRRRSVRDRTTA